MSKRFGDVESSCNGKESLEERLNAHSLLRDRTEMLMRVMGLEAIYPKYSNGSVA